MGLLKDAWQLILEENPFPAVCGRVCFHPCESACNLGNLDAPIAIHNLERFLGDTALSKARTPNPITSPARDQKVAIAGAGPAGLCNLASAPTVFGYIAGLGGRDITPQTLTEIYSETKKNSASPEESIWIGLNQEVVKSWRNGSQVSSLRS
jgi:hypothetical protein